MLAIDRAAANHEGHPAAQSYRGQKDPLAATTIGKGTWSTHAWLAHLALLQLHMSGGKFLSDLVCYGTHDLLD